MTNKPFKVIVELYDLLLTARKDDRFGRTVSGGQSKIDDLIAKAVTRRTDLNAATLKASYEILKEMAIEEVLNSKHVEFGLSHYGLKTNGVFIGDHASWNDSEHSLVISSTPTAEVREALKQVAVEVRGMASSGCYVNSLSDAVSGEVNTRITPGGGVNLSGVKIKITGDSPENGVFFTDVNSGQKTAVPATSILVNEPAKITLIVPADLPAGDYQLSVVTQFSTSNMPLKEPRSYVFDYILACG